MRSAGVRCAQAYVFGVEDRFVQQCGDVLVEQCIGRGAAVAGDSDHTHSDGGRLLAQVREDQQAARAAHLGIAMGRHGSDLALHTADAVIANLAIAATVIAVLVIWDLVGHLPLPLGVAGHEGSTVIVGLNGLRPLTKSAWNDTASTSKQSTTSSPAQPVARAASELPGPT